MNAVLVLGAALIAAMPLGALILIGYALYQDAARRPVRNMGIWDSYLHL